MPELTHKGKLFYIKCFLFLIVLLLYLSYTSISLTAMSSQSFQDNNCDLGLTQEVIVVTATTASVNEDFLTGTPPYSFDWQVNGIQIGQFSSTATNLLEGITYSLIVSDSINCQDSLEVTTLSCALEGTVVENPIVEGNVQVFANSGTPPYIYLWDNGSTAPFTNYDCSYWYGYHSVSVTDAVGCEVDIEFCVCLIESIDELHYLKHHSIYPNPVNERLNFEFEFDQAVEFECSIFDSNGKMMIGTDTQFGNSISEQIEFDQYPEGIYFIEFAINHQKAIERVIVQH